MGGVRIGSQHGDSGERPGDRLDRSARQRLCGADQRGASRPGRNCRRGHLSRPQSAGSLLVLAGGGQPAAHRRKRRGRGKATDMSGYSRGFSIPVLALMVLAVGCGYHLGGQADLIPKNVKTIAIAGFSNGTVQYQVATILTADVVREFHSRTHYTIVTDKE